jgi:hypothetical protein
MGSNYAFHFHSLVFFQPIDQFQTRFIICRCVKNQCFPLVDHNHPIASDPAKIIRLQVADMDKSIWADLLDLESFGVVD